MATLTQAVEVGDAELHINTPLSAGQVPGYVKIDDELFNVGGQNNTTGLILALSEPARQAHDSGATVTYAGQPYDPTFKMALAGGEQTIRLMGPVRVNYNTSGLTNANGLKIFDLSAGQVVLAVRVEVHTAWNADADLAKMTIGLGGAAYASGDWYPVRNYWIGSNYASPSDANTAPETAFSLGSDDATVGLLANGSFHRAVTAGAIVATVGGTTAGATAGAADIYALIAEPAS